MEKGEFEYGDMTTLLAIDSFEDSGFQLKGKIMICLWKSPPKKVVDGDFVGKRDLNNSSAVI